MNRPNLSNVQIVIDQHGTAHCVYDEILDLQQMGELSIRRSSYVEPDNAGRWTADLHPVGGPRLGPFSNRSEALRAELQWLETYWL